MIQRNLKFPALLVTILFMGMAQTGFGQDEYDDMYFSSKDRKKIKYAEETTDANITYESYSNNTYSNATYSAKEVNPEYIEKYKQQARESVADEIAEDSANPTYSSQDYFVEGEVTQHDDPAFYNNPKYNRQSQPTVTNNYYGGGYNAWGPSLMMSYNNWGGWSYGMSYGFGWGNSGYYDPFFYDPFFCPTYSYNRYRWYNQYYAYDRGFYHGYYAANGVSDGSYKQVTRGARPSRGSSVARDTNLSRMSATRPSRGSGRTVIAPPPNGRTSSSARIATTSSNTRTVAPSRDVRDHSASQNEYLRKVNVSTSRSRLSDLSNRTNSRSAVGTRTTYVNSRTGVVSNIDTRSKNQSNASIISRSTPTRSTRSTSGNVRRYSTPRASSASPTRNSISNGRSSSPSRSYSAPSRSNSNTRSTPSRSSSPSRSSGSSSRSSSRSRR